MVLYVPRDLYPEYASTPQWKEFNIQAGSTGSDTPVVAPADAAVSARFEGVTLHLPAWNSPVMIVRVVMTDGSAAALKLSR